MRGFTSMWHSGASAAGHQRDLGGASTVLRLISSGHTRCPAEIQPSPDIGAKPWHRKVTSGAWRKSSRPSGGTAWSQPCRAWHHQKGVKRGHCVFGGNPWTLQTFILGWSERINGASPRPDIGEDRRWQVRGLTNATLILRIYQTPTGGDKAGATFPIYKRLEGNFHYYHLYYPNDIW